MNDDALCETCPFCGGPPDLGLKAVLGWPHQAYCANPGCSVFNWNATETREWNRTHITVHDMDAPPRDR